MEIITIFSLLVIIYSAIIHEYAHGWMANRLGDKTAEYSGRLTLNPIPHIDPIGSILVPLFLVLSGSGFIIGWAKPVPFNPYNLSDQKYGSAKVAAAGPASNLIIAIIFGLFLRFFPLASLGVRGAMFTELISMVVLLNLLLMVFNLLPIPPLDGSKIALVFLPLKYQEIMYRMEAWGMILVFLVAYMLFGVLVWPLVSFLFSLITGF